MKTEETKEEILKEEVVKGEQNPEPKMRQIVIETDGNSIRIVKAETSGTIELVGILQNLIEFINKK